MTVKVGINGFGRIGRLIFRAIQNNSHPDIEVVHINDLLKPEDLAHLTKYDSVHGRLDLPVEVDGKNLKVGDKTVTLSSIKNPSELPWKERNVDIAFECTGLFTKREGADLHLKAGAKKVMISAPASGEDKTVVYGVNHEQLTAEDSVVSNGSCTTNCLAPVAKVLHEKFGVEFGSMTTVHSYTNDQRVLDVGHSDMRRARAAAVNMIPTSTGAAKAIGLVLPELAGKIDGLAVRVPTPNVSLVDVTFMVKKSVTPEQVNQALKEASEGSLKGILGYTEEPLVSSDFNGDKRSSIVDASMTKVTGGNMVKILSWYDNETGFSHRMLDVTNYMKKFLS
ncbi:MAG: type I glyceraldehyde-3-phosphate dehydrogenase [Oligoflexales bacterium]